MKAKTITPGIKTKTTTRRMKTITRLALLITVLSVIGGTSFFIQRSQVEKMGRAVIKKAELAEQAGDFATAEKLYAEHDRVYSQISREDVDVELKHADAILKVDNSPNGQNEALKIYSDILTRHSWHEDARRRLTKLKIEMRRFVSGPGGEGADVDLKILLKYHKDDRHLLFLQGRCYEAAEKYEDAVANYEKVVGNEAPEHKPPEWLEASQRRATLLRDQLKKTAEGDQAIEMMVRSDPKNAEVYLVRGQYHLAGAKGDLQKALRAGVRDDFQEALRLAPGKPEIYLGLAELAEQKSGPDAAERILEDGLKNAPKSPALYQNLARLELRAGQVEKAIKTLENGVRLVSEPDQLRLMLVERFLRPEDTGKLRLQLEELNKTGYAPLLVQYYTAIYHINNKDFVKARQSLLRLRERRGLPPELKASVNMLLSQCYRGLGDSEMADEANHRALIADPQNLEAKVASIATLVNQGEIVLAIKEYQGLVDRAPQVRLNLAQLLIARNRQRPQSERDWSEVKRVVDDMAKAAPESVNPVILEAELLLAQDKVDEARNLLEKARSRFPKSIPLREVQANLLGSQGKLDEARKLLDRAKEELGDQVDLRLARARLEATQTGPEVVKALNDLAQNAEAFSKENRRRLLEGLAVELVRQQDLEGAARLRMRLAEENPNDLKLRLSLLDLAFQANNQLEVEKNIAQIERIEGSDGLQGRFSRLRFLIWQAAQGSDKKQQAELRTRARELLKDLRLRRAESAVIPLALVDLEEQELRQGGLTDGERQAKETSLIRSYQEAIKLGQRNPAVLHRTLQLLVKNGDDGDVIELLNRLPAESQPVGNLKRLAEQLAIEKKNFQLAEQIARRAVELNPSDFRERFRLVQILLSSGRQAEAEAAIRSAVNLSKSDPDRWIVLVWLMVFTKQPEKAEQVLRDAEKNLPESKVPLTLAECCGLLGRLYDTNIKDDAKKRRWYGEAKNWYAKAQAAQPNDLSIKRRLTKFFLDTKQIDEVRSYLDGILAKGVGSQDASTVTWARRMRASLLTTTADSEELRKALALFEPAGQSVAGGQEGKSLEDPEDLRILARVLDFQRTTQHRKRAIEILESLTDKNVASFEDRLFLAGLYDLSGDWPKAREKYQELNARTTNLRDVETLNNRSSYLAQFAESLLRHRRPGQEQELSDAQKLIDELKQLQPNALSTLILQVEIERAHGQLDSVDGLIRAFAARPPVTSQVLESMANLAETLGRFKLAEDLYRQDETQSGTSQGTMLLAQFLGRQGRVKEALDICERLWTNPDGLERLVGTCVGVVLNDRYKSDPAELNRVSGWLDQALSQPQNQRLKTLMLVSLGNLRERQEFYQKAEDLYERAVKLGDGTGAAPSTMVLIASAYNNLAWLMALKDGKGREALEYINRAINLKGPLPDFLDTRGVVYLTVGDSQLAIDDLKKAVADAPSPAKYFHLAQAYLGAKERVKAKQSLEAAKITGWEQSGLHALEKQAYEKVLIELGAS